MTNNQILLKEIIKQECQNSSEYNNENSYFEFFAANQVLKDYEFSNEEITQYYQLSIKLMHGIDHLEVFFKNRQKGAEG